MAFQLTPLHIPGAMTDFSAQTNATARLGQMLGDLPGDLRKQQLEQQKIQQEQKARDEYARIGKAVADGTLNNRAAAGSLIGLGDIPTGFNFLKLDEAAKDRASDADLVKGLGIGSPASPASASTPQNLAPLFTQAQAKYGLPEGYLPRVAQIESSNNPNAQNPNSSAGGLFQFIDSTARNYGLTNKFDPAAATDAAARLAVDNKNVLTQALGREPTAGELYLAHQQGAGGASKLLANPNARAVDIVGERAVALNGGNANMTAGEFASKWVNKVDGARTAQAAPQAGAPISDAANVPAPGAANAEFVIPGTNTTVDQQTLSSNPRIQNMVRALGAARTPGAKETIGKMLELEIADAKQKQAINTPTDVQKNYELARRQGYQGSLLDYQKELRAQTNVNVDTGPKLESAYASSNGKAISDRFSKIVEEGDAANQEAGTLARIRELGGKITNIGKGAQLQKWLSDNGINVGPDVDEIRAYTALIDKLTPQQRIAGAGATSDYDAKMFKNSLPSLMNRPGGNELIMQTLEALNTYKRQRGDIVAEAMANNEKPPEVIKKLKEIPDPFAGFKDAAKSGFKNGPQAASQPGASPVRPDGSAPPQPSAQPPIQGSKQAPDGNWYVPDPSRPGKYLQVQ